MSKLPIIVLLAIICCASAYTSRYYSENQCIEKFIDFKEKYNKVYESDIEDARRYDIFKRALDYIAKRNSENLGFTLGINHLADLTNEEYQQKYLMQKPERFPGVSHSKTFSSSSLGLTLQDIPDKVDWVAKKMTTKVKDQEQCGSCWAFAVTETIESAWAIHDNNLTILSEQQILDCDKKDQGCNGGDMTTGYEYVIETGYQDTEKSYPYKAYTSKCKANPDNAGAHIHSYFTVPPRNTTEFLIAIATKGPLSIGIDASSSDFQYYQNGVYHGMCSQNEKSMDHAIQVVSYSFNSKGSGTVRARNSWSSSWGNAGYIDFMLDIKHNTNSCGMLNQAQGVDEI